MLRSAILCLIMCLLALPADAQTVFLNGTVLEITGTDGPDSVHVELAGGALKIDVAWDGAAWDEDPATNTDSFPIASVTALLILVGDGDDHVHLSSAVTIPMSLNGGAGNDTLLGGSGSDLITDLSGDNAINGGLGSDTIITGNGRDSIEGGDGNDFIFSGDGNDSVRGGNGNDVIVCDAGDDTALGDAGRDIIVGGLGRDSLSGNADDDLLIAGWSAHDSSLVALSAIADEWFSAATYSDRVGHLLGTIAGGANGGYLLNGSDVVGLGTQTVFDDNVTDVSSGSAGNDWFLANSVADNSLMKDIVVDKALAEVVTDIDLDTL